MKSVLYVSKAQIDGADADADLQRLVAAAQERNHSLGVTGMLVFTGEYFAQILEGPAEAVELILASIRQDRRHHSLIEQTQLVTTRSFGAWSLGYEGQCSYVDGLVRSFFGLCPDRDIEEAEAELRELMLLLALSRHYEAQVERLRA